MGYGTTHKKLTTKVIKTSNERQLLLMSELTLLMCLLGNGSMDEDWIIRLLKGSSKGEKEDSCCS